MVSDMDPNVDKPTSFNLPAPMEGGAVSGGTTSETLPQQPEFAVSPQQQPASSQLPPMPPQPAVPYQDQVNPSAVPTAPSPSTDTPAVADDTDLIEKEWVNKAKAIVEKTKEDPYTQNRELNEFKADYMQKRYNKAIKLSE